MWLLTNYGWPDKMLNLIFHIIIFTFHLYKQLYNSALVSLVLGLLL